MFTYALFGNFTFRCGALLFALKKTYLHEIVYHSRGSIVLLDDLKNPANYLSLGGASNGGYAVTIAQQPMVVGLCYVSMTF